MGIFDYMNTGVESIFKGMQESKHVKERQRNNRLNELSYTPFLFSSGYLGELLDDCQSKEDYESLLDHLYRHDATEVQSYKEIELDIIDHLRGKR